MILTRRNFLMVAASGAAAPTLSIPAFAADYPTRPAQLIIEVAAGGSPDIIGRIIADWLSQRLGQPFVVDDRPGAAGNIGTEYALKAVPDGYTLLLAMSSNAINVSVYHDLHFNFIQDAVPVAAIGTIPLIMEVNPSVPAKTIPEFIAYAKANPGKLNMGSGGVGSPLHVAGELFKMMAGIDMVHVPYRSEALALPDLLGGQLQVMFGVMPASLGYVKSGKLRALGVSSSKRQELLPDVPAVAEFLPGFSASGWYGIAAPKDTPNDIVEKLNKEVNAALADPTMKHRLLDVGCVLMPGTPDDFGKFIAAETEKWAKVVKFADIKPQ